MEKVVFPFEWIIWRINQFTTIQRKSFGYEMIKSTSRISCLIDSLLYFCNSVSHTFCKHWMYSYSLFSFVSCTCHVAPKSLEFIGFNVIITEVHSQRFCRLAHPRTHTSHTASSNYPEMQMVFFQLASICQALPSCWAQA